MLADRTRRIYDSDEKYSARHPRLGSNKNIEIESYETPSDKINVRPSGVSVGYCRLLREQRRSREQSGNSARALFLWPRRKMRRTSAKLRAQFLSMLSRPNILPPLKTPSFQNPKAKSANDQRHCSNILILTMENIYN